MATYVEALQRLADEERARLERRTGTLEERICQLYVMVDELRERIEVLEHQFD